MVFEYGVKTLFFFSSFSIIDIEIKESIFFTIPPVKMEKRMCLNQMFVFKTLEFCRIEIALVPCWLLSSAEPWLLGKSSFSFFFSRSGWLGLFAATIVRLAWVLFSPSREEKLSTERYFYGDFGKSLPPRSNAANNLCSLRRSVCLFHFINIVSSVLYDVWVFLDHAGWEFECFFSSSYSQTIKGQNFWLGKNARTSNMMHECP